MFPTLIHTSIGRIIVRLELVLFSDTDQTVDHLKLFKNFCLLIDNAITSGKAYWNSLGETGQGLRVGKIAYPFLVRCPNSPFRSQKVFNFVTFLILKVGCVRSLEMLR